MSNQGILSFSNVRKVEKSLEPIIGPAATALITAEIEEHSKKMFRLALRHYRFALGCSAQQWRHKISRLYYASYNASKTIRFYVEGNFNTDVSDHKKIGNLPSGFSDRERFENQLPILRACRNDCDYNHDVLVGDLVLSPKEAQLLTRDFLKATKGFLGASGLSVGGKI